MLIALSAFLLPLLWYSTWLVAVISLGRVPRIYADDPKFINGWVSTFHSVTLLAFFLALPLFVTNLAIAFAIGIQRYISEQRWRWTTLTPFGLTLMIWIAAVLLMKAGGPHIGCWFFD